jgi:hypothetical protein
MEEATWMVALNVKRFGLVISGYTGATRFGNGELESELLFLSPTHR